jgi:hypothetical protein
MTTNKRYSIIVVIAFLISCTLIVLYVTLRIPYRLSQIKSSNADTRNKAILALTGTIPAEYFDDIVELIHDKAKVNRLSAPWLLAKCYAKRAKYPLSKMLFDEDKDVRSRAAEVLIFCSHYIEGKYVEGKVEPIEEDVLVIKNLIKAFKESKTNDELCRVYISMSLSTISHNAKFEMSADDNPEEKLQLYLDWFYKDIIKSVLPDGTLPKK